MKKRIRLKQGLGILFGMAILAGAPSVLTAAEESSKAGTTEAEKAAPKNHVVEVEVTGETPLHAVLRSFDGQMTVDLGVVDPKAHLQIQFVETTEQGAVVEYSLGMRHKIENMRQGQAQSFSYEDQMITGKIFLPLGEETEVLRSVPFSLSFTLKELGRAIPKSKSAELKPIEAKRIPAQPTSSTPRVRMVPKP